MTRHVNEDECLHAGLNTSDVGKIARRLESVCKDAKKLGITVFFGGAASLRFDDGSSLRPLIIAYLDCPNTDGGCGAELPDERGLLRGE